MDNLQRVKVYLQKNEPSFEGFINQSFRFIGLMELMGILTYTRELIQGNQTAFKFDEGLGNFPNNGRLRSPGE
ncbi:MAG: hypothetical protein V7K72_24040 [Nostoc sp.]|uniref:hypothetical protein n=1 Tax=Nostoc sp. TaxID=1180 RepID=UPI002FFB43F9